MSIRSRPILRKVPPHETESHVTIDTSTFSRAASVNTPLLLADDYQAPATSHALYPNSKWLLVRNNMHKIRGWGAVKRISMVDQPFQDWYLFFQMRRELKRAEEQIRAIEYRKDFTPVRHFQLPIDATHVRRYNVSHVGPNDGIYYAGLGTEPIVLQYLLYYFSNECSVPYDSIFYTFLSDVNAVLHTNRERIHRVVVFRKLALILALAVFVIIIIMFFSLILSVLTTTSNLRQMYRNDLDEDTKWLGSEVLPNVNSINKQ
ncbi:unnamed protein product [Rotaria socialis]|uniref:Uncharacterized protein n=1 Tax=Rotaria socialis TaxID=392032 RepID=A0A820L753_9BILA|nr:unnamed protein product [Rotaria socialis]CAF3367050.1 unnamed protein product [Rotaria socialis]CAF3491075.1 unnamed protein product [Rotaria socialis]CAF3707090.1 unnamed protein product [Rotaria socialis]CAF4278197.1 unnamed protein product [Rotaria socialis]